MSTRKFLRTFYIIILSAVCCAYPFGNIDPVDGSEPMAMSMAEPIGMTTNNIYLNIDPNDYSFLIYNCHGGEEEIGNAMTVLGIHNCTWRDAFNPVTANDLESHDILITSWNYEGNSSGLDPNILFDGITGTVILTGHDSDYHTSKGIGHSKTLFSQMINYVLTSSAGTGMIGLADAASTFNWTPSEWGVSATGNSSNYITEFTEEGIASGIYDGLVPDDLANWNTSHHNTFTEWSEKFMPFELGGSEPNEVITISAENIRPRFSLLKYDDVTSCVSPYDANEITYTIEYSLSIDAPADVNAVIIDYLPAGVTYPVSYTLDGLNVISSDPNYDEANHTYTWNLGTISPGDSGSVTLTVYVNEKANPYGTLHNRAVLTSVLGSVTAHEYTDVCGWNPPENPYGIIYVDKDAKGFNTGVRWKDAYVDLQNGLARAGNQAGAEIWVAEGSYYPAQDSNPNISFALVDDTEIYGGFKGVETVRNQRKYTHYKTYLCGDISATDEDPNSNYVVTAADGITDRTILDGFIICCGVKAGIHLYDQAVMDDWNDPNTPDPNCNISPNIVNCFITQNDGDGIHGQLADPNIYSCIISDNGGYGIIDANSLEIKIDRCVIRDNGLAGIDAHIADSGHITNCFIYHNAAGIYCYGVNGTEFVTIRNNTIVYNDGLAVQAFVGSDMPVVNSILWGNSDSNQVENCLPDYCFIDVNSTIGTTNYYTDPGFAYSEPNACNYHLAADSSCIDAGLTAVVPTSEKDIDGESRIYNLLVDIGADEVTACDDVYNAKDHNGDGIVNLIEYSLLSSAWMTYDPCSPPDTGDPNFLDDFNPDGYDSKCDYDSDGLVYTTDLYEFAPDWLWQACWRVAAEGSWFEFYSTGSSRLAVEGLPSAAVKMCIPVSSTILVGGEAMMSMPMSATTTSISVEPSLEDQYLQAQETLDFLNMIYKEELKGQVDQKQWNEFIDHIEDWVNSLAEDFLKSTE